MFESSPGREGDAKSEWLARLKAEGVYLIALVPFAVDKLPPDGRRQAPWQSRRCAARLATTVWRARAAQCLVDLEPSHREEATHECDS